jgi:chlorobactene glucosyltransferase
VTEPLPRAAILLPVRDEERNVAECVRTLLRQGPVDRVVVIDDGSEDRTREIVAGLVTESPRLTLLEAGELPAGWKGKVHALHAGSRQVGSPWVLCTDADTRHHPELLARALATAEARGLDSISVAGFQETLGLGESLLTPAVFAVLDGILGDWRDAADGASEVANGQFFLVRREALDAVGGFESVRGEPLDDLALAGKLRAAGFRHAFFRAPDLLRVRMYEGLGASLRGWRRNLGGLFAGRYALAASVLLVLLFPPLLALRGLLTRDWAAVAVTWAAGALASTLLRRDSGHPAAVGLLYPADALLTAACLILGLKDARKGRLAPWKGRSVVLGE